MKQRILKHQSMSVHGKYLLRSIQNESLPTLDLLIRECVQNSLDASLSDDTSYKVKVDCIVRECDCRALNKVFEGISEELDKRYGDKKNIEFIAIRDSGTTGLTGPLREKDIDSAKNFGNLRKLVYEFGQCQENIGKGGSWGIGKTVCFRVGNGIVLYYSRIQVEDGTYQERLAAALVEDETGKNPLLKNSYTNGAPTGICWWGDTDPVDYSSMPLTDEKEIHKVIDIFGIQPYRNDETGTCIIIPYIDSKALLENADAEYEAHGDTMGSMLKKIAQRWYFPRINNSHYPYGCQLNFMVNQLPIKEAETHTFFQYMQELYNYSADVIQKPRTKLPAEIHCSEISLRNEFTQSGKAGVVLWREVTNQDLEMCIPNNEPSPYGLINKPDEKDEDGNPAIIAYCRHAGMIIDYEVRSAWTVGIPEASNGHFLLAFFQPNGDNTLNGDENITLDEYLRRSENADHHSWEDSRVNGKVSRIIEKIIKQVPKKIAESLSSNDKNTRRTTDKGLQKLLGKKFLPPKGYGTRPSGSKTTATGGQGPSSSSRDIVLNLSEPVFQSDGLHLSYQLSLKADVTTVKLAFKAHTTSSEMNIDEWEKEIGTPFPVQLLCCDACVNGSNIPVKLLCTDCEDAAYGAELDFSACHGYSRIHAEGEICFKTDDAISASVFAQILK